MIGGGSVFVSHTSDMAAYPPGRSFVHAAVEAVLKAGLHPVDMTQFAARGDPPAEYCQQQVRACDLYLAVVGFRYGTPVPYRTDGVSFTELEFLAATEAGMPRLVFVLDDDTAVPRSLVDRDSSAIDGFRERLHHANVIVRAVTTPVDLGEAVLHALYEQRLEQARRGDARRGGGTSADNTAGGPRRPWMAPPLDRVVERPELGDRLVAALTGPRPTDVGLSTALHGAGGFGKTTLAAWVCHRPEINRRYPGGLLWVAVGQEVRGADLAEKVNDLAFLLSGRRPAISDPDTAGAELGRLLDEREEPMLLVIDDVWETAQLRPFRFGGRACTRLVTTRMSELLPTDGPRIVVDVMSAGQAAALVAQEVGGLPADVTDRLAALAGRWPVLLSLVNSALRRRVARGQSPGKAAHEIQRLLSAHGPTAFDPARPGDRNRAVAATVEASLTLLDPDDRQRYLDLAIFPEDIEIPLDVLALLWPGCRVDAVCEEFAGLSLVADYRLDHPGPRLVLHDVLRAYLRARRNAADRAPVHRRLISAAAGLLAAPDEEPTPWWRLPAESGYLWCFLPFHLHEAGMSGELAALVCDLRWVEAKTRQAGSAVGTVADAELVDNPIAATLARVLRHAAHLLAPMDPPEALGAILASRLHGVPGLETTLGRYVTTLSRPRLEPAWPLPDRLELVQPSLRQGHAGTVEACDFSPDGRLLASAGDDGTVRLWDVATGRLTAVLRGYTGGVRTCVFSPGGRLLAFAGSDGTVRVWDVAAGKLATLLRGHSAGVLSCAFSPDGRLASAGTEGKIQIWDLAAGLTATLEGHAGGVYQCAFSPDSRSLASVGTDGKIYIWDVAAGKLETTLEGNADGVWDCVFSPDGRSLTSAGADGTVRVWDVATGMLTAVLAGHVGEVNGCAFSPDGQSLASASDDRTVRIWDLATRTATAVLEGHGGFVRKCVFSADGRLLASASDDGTVRIWDVFAGKATAVLGGSAVGAYRRCAFSPDGRLLAFADDHGAVQIWDVATGRRAVSLEGNIGGARGCAFSPDGKLLVAGYSDGPLQIWDVATRRVTAILAGHTGGTWVCVFSPDGQLVASGGADNTIRICHVATSSVITILEGHGRATGGCAFSPDGRLVASASGDGWLQIWDVATGMTTAVLEGHTDWVSSCAFSPDGRLLASTSGDGSLRVWDFANGTATTVLEGHAEWVWGCAFSADGRFLASASHDWTLRVWDVASHTCTAALRVAHPLYSCAWHPHEPTIAAAGGGGVYLFAYRT